MADVIKSREADGVAVAKDLRHLTEQANKLFKKEIISPLTVTLGDEFQGVINSMQTGIEIIWKLEEMIIEKQIAFKLRYVLSSGKIETPVNRKIAHGMLGEGLTRARELLNKLKKSEERFYLAPGKNDSRLNKFFILYQSQVDDWKTKDFTIISDFLKLDDYKTVADKNKKSWSLMWKRRRTLKIKEYKTIKDLISEFYGIVH